MNTVIVGLGLGVLAAVLDVIPMFAQKLPLTACISAMVQWVFLGVVISNCQLGLPGWATGLILGGVGAVPIILMLFGHPVLMPAGQEAKTILPIMLTSLVLGTAVGLVSRLVNP